MNKRKIENLRKVAQPEVANTSSRSVAEDAGGASAGKADADRVKGHLELFYAARLASKDFDRSMIGTPQKIAKTALDEAVDATKVWEREVDKAAAEIMEEIWK